MYETINTISLTVKEIKVAFCERLRKMTNPYLLREREDISTIVKGVRQDLETLELGLKILLQW